jgi:predicted secreted hydrolase
VITGFACGAEVAPLVPVAPADVSERSFVPIQFPDDEAPHRNLSEWWYFTGRLETDDGRELGFEFVIFQAVRRDGPPAYAAHFAVADLARKRVLFTERTSIGLSTARPDELALCVDGWWLALENGRFTIQADMVEYRLELELEPVYEAVQHNGGVLDFGEFGWSYYYSYPRLSLSGRLNDTRGGVDVSGSAWFDHQWGDFIDVSSGGWDWMSLRLDDGRDLMLTEIWDERRRLVLAYATLSGVGRPLHLEADSFTTIPLGIWTSPRTGTSYPAAWRVLIPELGLDLEVSPVFPDQELDTSRSTGTIYWEGLVDITSNGRSVGHGYVELTGYAKEPGVEFKPDGLHRGRSCEGSVRIG